MRAGYSGVHLSSFRGLACFALSYCHALSSHAIPCHALLCLAMVCYFLPLTYPTGTMTTGFRTTSKRGVSVRRVQQDTTVSTVTSRPSAERDTFAKRETTDPRPTGGCHSTVLTAADAVYRQDRAKLSPSTVLHDQNA